MNAPLFQLFQFFKAYFNGYDITPNYEIQPDAGLNTNFVLNGVTVGPFPLSGFNTDDELWLKIPQERSALYLLNGIQSIVFISNSLTMAKEFVAADTGKVTSIPILSDFVPDLSAGRDLSEYQYNASHPRLINLNNTTPITNMQFEIKVQARNGQLYDLYLEPGEVISVKFEFVLKSLYNSQFSNEYDIANNQAYYMRASDVGSHSQHTMLGMNNIGVHQLGGAIPNDSVLRAALSSPSDLVAKSQNKGTGRPRGRPKKNAM